MSDWPKWDYRVSPGGLADYVQPRLVRKALGRAAGALPGPDSEADRLGQVKDIYAVFQRRRIRYVEAPFASGDGGQDIRTPGEVLGRGGSGTCLDLAVVFAAACMHAGLKPVVVVLAAVEDNQADHAVVLVWLDPAGERYPLDAPYYANYHHPGRLRRHLIWRVCGSR
ncbi:transglutaminase-like putative cysteine protease [Streptomyces sp. SLBN-8D4]